MVLNHQMFQSFNKKSQIRMLIFLEQVMTLVLLILYFMKSGIQQPVMESVSDCSRSLGDLTGERVLMLVVSKIYHRVLNYTELVIYEDNE